MVLLPFPLQTRGPDSAYFDVVFTTDREDPNAFLPSYCIDTKKIHPDRTIFGIDEKILLNENITEAWRILGEQSEIVVRLVCAHKETVEIPSNQIAQFMHFFMNPLKLGHQSIFFGSDIDYAL